ncbi:MAG: ADP-ribosylation factor-like protein [Candidatus Hodarchaeota archaeon]
MEISLLHNIFLFKGKEFQDLEDLNIYSYPNEIININNKNLVNKIITGHDRVNIINKHKTINNLSICNHSLSEKSKHYKIDKPVAQVVDDLNIYTSCINGRIVIGLIFDKEDNPYDYKEIFEELLNELLNNGTGYSFDDEIEIENLLISMFIDIRRYGDEIVEKSPEIVYYYQKELFIKAFLFGIDEVGKTSLVRRIKTGKFNDNFFSPTRKFNIEYIEEQEKGLLAFWDMPGQRNFRKKWLIGLQDSNIIVFMIDIANQLRFEESKKEFWNIVKRDELIGIPLLIMGNKIDLIKSSEKSRENQLEKLKKELFDFFSFENIEDRNWTFLFTSVKTKYNIDLVIQSIFDLVASK